MVYNMILVHGERVRVTTRVYYEVETREGKGSRLRSLDYWQHCLSHTKLYNNILIVILEAKTRTLVYIPSS